MRLIYYLSALVIGVALAAPIDDEVAVETMKLFERQIVSPWFSK